MVVRGSKIGWNAISYGLSRRRHRFKSGWGRQEKIKGLGQAAHPFYFGSPHYSPHTLLESGLLASGQQVTDDLHKRVLSGRSWFAGPAPKGWGPGSGGGPKGAHASTPGSGPGQQGDETQGAPQVGGNGRRLPGQGIIREIAGAGAVTAGAMGHRGPGL
jgi:hypothetical protein